MTPTDTEEDIDLGLDMEDGPMGHCQVLDDQDEIVAEGSEEECLEWHNDEADQEASVYYLHDENERVWKMRPSGKLIEID